MISNVGVTDRVLRVTFAALVAILWLAGMLSGLAGVILGILAVVFLVTGLVGSCPLYRLFGLSTRKQTA